MGFSCRLVNLIKQIFRNNKTNTSDKKGGRTEGGRGRKEGKGKDGMKKGLYVPY